MKKIPFKNIKKITDFLQEIWCLEDDGYVDRRKTEPKYRSINRLLDNITKNKEERTKIYDAIEKELFNFQNFTYKPICNNLRDLGYEIIFEKNG